MKTLTHLLTVLKDFVEGILCESRFLLVPFYLGLIVAQVIYCYKFGVSLVELTHNFRTMDETKTMLAVLTLIDITMIANLIKMIITGSYQSFVEKMEKDHSEKISSGYLKVKMGGSLIGVSSIHLLQTFINSSEVNTRDVVIKCTIHLIFLISTIGLALIDHWHVHNKATLTADH
jgi:uncharacterized protein (TIGR00645 family)